MAGVFITRGMKMSVPPGGLILSEGSDGTRRGSLTLHVHYDVCPTWLQIASHHLADAEDRKLARVAAWEADDQDARAAILEKECESSMQAIMAAAIAVDSFYLSVRDKTNIPKETLQIWRDQRTARYKQITEVLRRAFTLAPRQCVSLRKFLKDLFTLRDLAVHPSGDLTAPIYHPELQVGVEWRFAFFRTDNARLLVQGAKHVVNELVTNGKPSTQDVERYADELRNLLSAASTKPG